MGKAKRVRAKEHKIKKMTNKMVKKHVTAAVPQKKPLSVLCNQFAYGRIGPGEKNKA